jgi:hypothetical protein
MSSGDGCFWWNTNRRKKITKNPLFKSVVNDKDALEKFFNYCNELNISCRWGQHYSIYKGNKVHAKAIYTIGGENALKIKDLMDLDIFDFDFIRGWLAGFFDAEGTYRDGIRIAQLKNIYLDKLKKFKNIRA